jgi:hypothetical protein
VDLIAIKCGECGAKLRVWKNTALVDCELCDTQLAVDRADEHRERAAAQTEQLILEGRAERNDST